MGFQTNINRIFEYSLQPSKCFLCTSPLHTSQVQKWVCARKSVPAWKLIQVWPLNSKVSTSLFTDFYGIELDRSRMYVPFQSRHCMECSFLCTGCTETWSLHQECWICSSEHSENSRHGNSSSIWAHCAMRHRIRMERLYVQHSYMEQSHVEHSHMECFHVEYLHHVEHSYVEYSHLEYSYVAHSYVEHSYSEHLYVCVTWDTVIPYYLKIRHHS